MAKFDPKAIWTDIKAYRRVYFLTAVASFGGMLFGWDTGLIGMRQQQSSSPRHS
jgi:SP family sugar:H+ symporter-like MFS transporter